jgi:hypothetical protein
VNKALTHGQPPDHKDYRKHWTVKRDLARARQRLNAHNVLTDEQFAVLIWEASGVPTADTSAAFDRQKNRWDVFVNLYDYNGAEPKVVYKRPAEISAKDFDWQIRIGKEAMLKWIDRLEMTDSHALAYNAATSGIRHCPPQEGRKIAAQAFLEEWIRMHPDEDPKSAPSLERVFSKLGVNAPTEPQKRKSRLTLDDEDPFAPKDEEERKHIYGDD